MRLAGQAKMGYYPAAPAAVKMAAGRLRAPGKPFAMLDPSAGEGAALPQLAADHRCRPADVYAIELDESRGEAVEAALPEAQVLAPASFFGCKVTPGSMSLAWLNPPFDDGYGGTRVEANFLYRAAAALRTGGVLAFVRPEDQIDCYWGDVSAALLQWFDRITTVPFPEECRPFNEVIT